MDYWGGGGLSGGGGGKMASKAANVSLYSVRDGKLPAGDAALGQETNLMFKSWDKWDVSKFLWDVFGDGLVLVLEPDFETLCKLVKK